MNDVNTNVNDVHVGGAKSGSIYLMSGVNTNVIDVGGLKPGSIYLMSDVNTNVSDVGGKAWEHLSHE